MISADSQPATREEETMTDTASRDATAKADLVLSGVPEGLDALVLATNQLAGVR